MQGIILALRKVSSTDNELLDRIASITEEIAELPRGYISKKTIGAKAYFYHQWSEQGVKKSQYLLNCRAIFQMIQKPKIRQMLQKKQKILPPPCQ